MSADLILVLLATGGTAALVGAAFLFGFNKSAVIADEAAAKHFLYLYASDIAASFVVLSSDQSSALIASQDNRIFLVTMLGEGAVTRELRAGDISRHSEGDITIDVHDFGFPARHFRADKLALQSILDIHNQGRVL